MPPITRPRPSVPSPDPGAGALPALPALRVTLGQHSQAGRRDINQDFHGAVQPANHLLRSKGVAVALADGIGSSAVSQIASAAAVRGFLEDYYCTAESWSVLRSAQCVLGATNAWLHTQTQRGDGRFDKDRGYVCTFTALILKGREAHLLHVGDTRLYRLHAQALEQLSEDHRVHVSSVEHYLGRALGITQRVDIDYRRWDTEVGEVYLLATDGLYPYIDAADVHEALRAHADDLDAAAAALVQRALTRGSDDNLTVQLVRIDALPQAEAPLAGGDHAGLALPPPLHARMKFEGYTIVRPLHLSDRSHVHLATDDTSGDTVVIKTPSTAVHDDARQLERFALEEWVARRLHHAHVLKPAPATRPRQHLFVAMEYIEGQTLAQWMVDHPRPSLDVVRGIVHQIGQGLQAFHRKEMLHQDLRPANIMIDRTGTVRIIDFGSVHVAGMHEGFGDARPHEIAGTLQYTAPEYFLGEGGSEASDLFALAVLCYQMLTGQLPYGLQVTQLRSRADLRRLRYVPLRTHRPDLPAWLEAVLQQALCPTVAGRYSVVSALLHDLQHPPRTPYARQTPALIERDPVRFWQTLSAVLAVACMVLLMLLVAPPGGAGSGQSAAPDPGLPQADPGHTPAAR